MLLGVLRDTRVSTRSESSIPQPTASSRFDCSSFWDGCIALHGEVTSGQWHVGVAEAEAEAEAEHVWFIDWLHQDQDQDQDQATVFYLVLLGHHIISDGKSRTLYHLNQACLDTKKCTLLDCMDVLCADEFTYASKGSTHSIMLFSVPTVPHFSNKLLNT